jgi:HrpA-like RNA helicase
MIRYLTDGFLLQELLSNPLLPGYCCIVIDEAHKTTVATDILLAMEVAVSFSGHSEFEPL